MKNILILTPDRVGSTLLQRLVTIYAYFNNASSPIPAINVHELTNGIEVGHSTYFQTDIVSKRNAGWSYYQSLPQIEETIKNANHPVVARLAKYHLEAREDSKINLLKFYEFLNHNFFIISARRSNIFEQALSWCIYKESKKLNVFSTAEKEKAFAEIYRNGIHIDAGVFRYHLDLYVDYERWSNRHFNISAHFYYDKDFVDVENYILNSNPFSSIENKKTWKEFADIEFHDWNRIHYLTSLRTSPHKLEDFYSSEDLNKYYMFKNKIQNLVDIDVLPSMVPYKLQTLKEKSNIVTNFDECVETYSNWVHTSEQQGYSVSDLHRLADVEDQFYHQLAIKPIEVHTSFLKP